VDFAGKSTWVSFLISLFTTFVTASVYLRTSRGEKITFKNLFEPLTGPMFIHFVLAMTIAYVFIFAGLILLIVPGVIVASALCFTSYRIFDMKIHDWKGDYFWQAIRESFEMTKGHRGRIIVFLLAILALNILGVIALGIGILITMPITGIAIAHIYNTLKNKGKTDSSNEPTPATSTFA
jgi:uncharacterized membrane protein